MNVSSVNPAQIKEFLELLENEGQSGQIIISLVKGKINHVDVKDSHDPKSFSYHLSKRKKHKTTYIIQKSDKKTDNTDKKTDKKQEENDTRDLELPKNTLSEIYQSEEVKSVNSGEMQGLRTQTPGID